MNSYKYQVVEWSHDILDGTSNRIVASAATLRGCLSQYQKHLKTIELAKINRKNLVSTVFYCDNIKFDVLF